MKTLMLWLFSLYVVLLARVSAQTIGTGSTSNITALVTSKDIENFVSNSEKIRPLNTAVNITITTNTTTTVTNVTQADGSSPMSGQINITSITSVDNNGTQTITTLTNKTETGNTTTTTNATCPLLPYQPVGGQLIIFLNENRTCNLVVATRRVLLPFVPFQPLRSTYRMVAILQNTEIQRNSTCPTYPATIRGNYLIIITKTGESNCFMVVSPEIRPVLVFNGLQQQFVDTVVYRISTPTSISNLG